MDKDLKGLASAYQQVQEAMDPVNKAELKGKHKDRKDKDIDNDGDVDASDKYLHKRRKAISKSKKKDGEGDVEMNPKLDKGSSTSIEQKESVGIRSKLISVLEKKEKNPNADKAEKPEDALKGQGAKDMMDQPKEINNDDEKGHDDATKAGRTTKAASARNAGDQVRSGDQKVVNAVAAAYKAMKNG